MSEFTPPFGLTEEQVEQIVRAARVWSRPGDWSDDEQWDDDDAYLSVVTFENVLWGSAPIRPDLVPKPPPPPPPVYAARAVWSWRTRVDNGEVESMRRDWRIDGPSIISGHAHVGVTEEGNGYRIVAATAESALEQARAKIAEVREDSDVGEGMPGP